MEPDEAVDRVAIIELVTRYYRAMDRIDNELGISMFHEDGTADYGPDIVSGTARDVVTWLNVYNESLITSHHSMSNVTITLDGDRAASEAYVSATLVQRGESGGTTVRRVYGRYIDRLSKREGKWGIDHRFYRRDFYWEETGHDVHVGDTSTRDAADPSYEALGLN